MKIRPTQDAVVGIVALTAGLVIVLVWAPLDSETGLAQRVRGRWSIGDSLAPTVAGALLAISGFGLAVRSLRSPTPALLSVSNLRFAAAAALCLAAALATMRYAGPLIADLTIGDYRPLRDTAPWKYVGFVLGGGILITGLRVIAEGRTSWTRVALALAGVLALALAYDLPFEDLLMPPNGDV